MSTDGQSAKWRRNIAENFNRQSRVHERYRQTTDRRATAYSDVCQKLSLLFMAALCNRAGHYIFALWFLHLLLSSSIFFYLLLLFHRLISAVAGWMSTILLHMVWSSANLECRSEMCCTRLSGNAGPKKSLKIRHLGTIPQLCRAISSQLRHVSTI